MQWLSFFDSKRQHGFTLVELLVVLAISAIILSIAVPSFINIISNSRVETAVNEVVVAINLAKSEAVKTGQTTVFCQSSTGTECSSDRTAWADGWILFSDTDGDKVLDDNERLIRIRESFNPELQFNLNEGKNSSLIRFLPNGRLKPNGSFCFRNSVDATNSRKVVLFRTGRIRTDTWNSDEACKAS